ncbi:hypothetical protein K377_02031 [Streptomyces sp. PsTaAH-137]|nr:hypothetical protein K377_02031 [Streptomyces sp. PsTaAH-137]
MSMVGLLPPETPWWAVCALLALALLVLLARAVMPSSSADRVKWWDNFWKRRK